MSRHVIRQARRAVVIAGLPATAAAQTLTGAITDRTSGVPLPNVIVLLLDSAGAQVNHGLTNDGGIYRLSTSRAGTFRLRTLRVGFVPQTSEPVRLNRGETITRDIALGSVPVRLGSVVVAGQSTCQRYQEDGSTTATVWEQARTAILATKLGQDDRTVRATLLSYSRSRDAQSGRLISSTGELRSGVTAGIYASLPAERLSRDGYVRSDASGTSFYAPDLDVLLSDVFVRDHCFRLADSPQTAGLLALTFEPATNRRRTPEIRGVLWLDRASHALQRLEFSYANAGSIVERSGAGGLIDFIQLRSGRWAIANWAVRMPVVERASRTGGLLHAVEVRELHEAGGRLVFAFAAAPSQDTLWEANRLPLGGMVLGAGNRPVHGALVTVQGLASQSIADAGGRFELPNLLPGTYVVEVRTPQLMAAGNHVAVAVTLVDSSQAVAIRLPAVATSQMSGFAGRISVDSTDRPVVGAEVSLPALGRTVMTNGRGQFEIHDIPEGMHRLLVRRLGYGPLDTTLVFSAGRFAYRRIHLAPVQLLAAVEVTAERSIASFEEHRRNGIGTFFTRADLAKLENLTVRTIMSQVPGAQIMSGAGPRAWIATGRASGRKITYPAPEDARMGAKPACYAHVYVDGIRVSPPGLFDVNSVNVDQIEAMEYYAGPATTPLRYAAGDAICGVLVIWLRRG